MNNHSTATISVQTGVKTKTGGLKDLGINPDPQGFQKLLWTEIEIKLKAFLKSAIEEMLNTELDARVGADYYERSSRRRTYRNGHYDRRLGTLYGTVGLDVPRLREGSIEYRLFDQYARRGGSIDQAIGTLFMNGVSTRKLARIVKDVIGVDLSSSTVSRIETALGDQDLKSFQEKELSDEYRFIFLDGISLKTRHISVERDMMLAAVGLKANGEKEIIGARLAKSESEKDWSAFLADMKGRGLKGKALELCIIDGNAGLKAALKSIYPFKPIQRCIAHKMRNVAVKIRRANQAVCLKGAKAIWASPSRTEAIRRFRAWKEQWEVCEEGAVRILEKDLEECLTYFQFSNELWKKIRTTNIIERTFREIRRRTKPMSIALQPKATERLFTSLSKDFNHNWSQSTL